MGSTASGPTHFIFFIYLVTVHLNWRSEIKLQRCFQVAFDTFHEADFEIFWGEAAA